MATTISFPVSSHPPMHCVAIYSDDVFLVDFQIGNGQRKQHIFVDVNDLSLEERREFISLFDRFLRNALEDEEPNLALERESAAIPAHMLIEAPCPVCSVAALVCFFVAILFLSFTHTRL